MNPASSRLKPRPDTLLLGLIALSVLVRLWGIADRLPDPTLGVDPIVANTAVDEGDRRAMYYAWDMWRGGARPIDLNPGTGDWPGLPFYLTLGLQLLYRAYDAVTHGNVSAAAFERHAGNDPAGMFLLARIFNVLIGVLTVYLVYVLGRKLGGRALGLWAAALIAFNPAHILASQRVSDPNLLALLFVLLATIQLVDAGAERRTRSSVLAGAMIGLAAACKYVPMALVLLIVLVQLERGKGGPVRALRFRWQPAVLGVLAALAAFAIASPFTILDWGAKAQSLSLQRGRLLGEWVGISEAPVSLPTYLTRTFPEMLGWPAYLLAILGSILLFRLPPRGWVVALVPVVLLLPTGALALAQERFMLPAMGSLAVAAAYAAIRLASWLGSARAAPRVAQAPLPSSTRGRCSTGRTRAWSRIGGSSARSHAPSLWSWMSTVRNSTPSVKEGCPSSGRFSRPRQPTFAPRTTRSGWTDSVTTPPRGRWSAGSNRRHRAIPTRSRSTGGSASTAESCGSRIPWARPGPGSKSGNSRMESAAAKRAMLCGTKSDSHRCTPRDWPDGAPRPRRSSSTRWAPSSISRWPTTAPPATSCSTASTTRSARSAEGRRPGGWTTAGRYPTLLA